MDRRSSGVLMPTASLGSVHGIVVTMSLPASHGMNGRKLRSPVTWCSERLARKPRQLIRIGLSGQREQSHVALSVVRHRVFFPALQHSSDEAGGVALEVNVGILLRHGWKDDRRRVVAAFGYGEPLERGGQHAYLIAPQRPDSLGPYAVDDRRCLEDGVEHARRRRLLDDGAIETVAADSCQVSAHFVGKRGVGDDRDELDVRTAQRYQVVDHRPTGNRHQRLGHGRLQA